MREKPCYHGDDCTNLSGRAFLPELGQYNDYEWVQNISTIMARVHDNIFFIVGGGGRVYNCQIFKQAECAYSVNVHYEFWTIVISVGEDWWGLYTVHVHVHVYEYLVILAYIHPLDNYSPSCYYHICKYMYWPALSAFLFIISGRGSLSS